MSRHIRRAIAGYGIANLIALASSAPVFAQSSTDLYSYDAKGRLVQVQTGQGVKNAYSFDRSDNRSRLTVQKQLDTSWAGTALYHQTGFAESSGGWAANIYSPQGYMTYGPYTNSVAIGNRTAVWRMLVDTATYPDPATIAVLDVYDATTGETIASRTLTWTSFAASSAYQIFELPFTVDAGRAGHSFEFRTYYTARAYLNVERIGFY
ncbi:hypothetical protein [Sphingobium fuliginis]|uniref:RHS repeat protein n=1 Tax=Sphingobium fuliginis ATCC 27551 TaxID=1208342 RepID=A0A5B8CB21_SPHSA|nr:hypothetical protein [Sphingobium fuliginis]QDC36363.1 hypothetical protein FIL70_02995 [Sphingobium fuliginis ATCC 27551]